MTGVRVWIPMTGEWMIVPDHHIKQGYMNMWMPSVRRRGFTMKEEDVLADATIVTLWFELNDGGTWIATEYPDWKEKP